MATILPMILKNNLFVLILSGIAGLSCYCDDLNSQDTIYLENPSFEDMPRKGGQISAPIKGWHDCGLSQFPSESPPDIHPVASNAWEVSMLPFEGYSYLGLVVRFNDTYESVSQKINPSLVEGKCYSFSAILARSERYKSSTRRSSNPENFIQPAILKIWGVDDVCSRRQLLGETVPVDNSDWMQFDFIFNPIQSWSSITIEAYYNSAVPERYNGHIMVDGLSSIMEVNCD